LTRDARRKATIHVADVLLGTLKDTVDVVVTVGEGVVKLEDLPGRERQRYRDAVDATFEILRQAVGLLSNRLRDIHNQDLDPSKAADRAKLARELRALDDLEAWHTLEGEVRLCSGLRVAKREMEGLRDRLSGRIALEDWNGFHEMVDALLAGESALAKTLAGALYRLAQMEGSARTTKEGATAALRAIDRTWQGLKDIRLRIMTKHVEFYDAI
jgi:hypothetical protein